jgi:hypothetical protein
MSAPTLEDVFSAGLTGHDDYSSSDARDFAPLKDITPSDHFSTATWFLPSGRTARSAASAAHCEDDANISRIRRVILSLSGRKLQEQSETF